jgi:DNA-binding NtrC family response regulator
MDASLSPLMATLVTTKRPGIWQANKARGGRETRAGQPGDANAFQRIRYEDAVREFKRQYLREVLVANRGNQCKAAEELGIHRNTLSRAMAELGLNLAEVRAGLKRPPRSERPVYSTMRQDIRQG